MVDETGGMEVLAPPACWALLRSAQVGRLAVVVGGEPVVEVTGRRFPTVPREHWGTPVRGVTRPSERLRRATPAAPRS